MHLVVAHLYLDPPNPLFVPLPCPGSRHNCRSSYPQPLSLAGNPTMASESNRMTSPKNAPERPPKLQDLPGEILNMVSKNLPVESQAALVLSSRTMLSRLGVKAIFPPWWYSYPSLGALLYKDRDSLPEDYCESNREVHPYFAGVVRFHIIKAVMDSWRAMPRRDANSQTPFILRHRRVLHLRDPDNQANITVECHHEFYIVQGRLLLKTEKSLLLQAEQGRADPKSSMGVIGEVRKLFERDPALNYCCGHKNWLEWWPTVLEPPAENSGPEHTAGPSPMDVCLWTHPRGCYCYRGGRKPFENFCARACRECHTDISVGFSDLERRRSASGTVPRVVYLITWKDLGCGKSILEQEWQCHFVDGESTGIRSATGHLRDGTPTIYERYESPVVISTSNWIVRALSRQI